MKSKLPISFLASCGLAAAAWGTAAHAQVASVSNKCAQKQLPQIINPTNSTGVIFDEECTTAYVLPPETGEAKITQLARSANLQFCPAVLQAGTTANTLMLSISQIAEQINKLIRDYEPLRLQIVTAQDALSAAQVVADRVRAETTLEEQRFAQIQGELLTVKSDYDTCKLFKSEAECVAEKQAFDAKKVEYVAQSQKLNAKRLEKITADSQQAAAQAQKTNLESQYANAIAPLNPLLTQLTTLNTTAFNLYKDWAPLEGATGQIVYSVNWPAVTNAYAAQNAGVIAKGVTFRPVPISEGQFFATMKLPGADAAQLASIPALLSAIVPGAMPYGGNHLSGGNVKILPSVTNADTPRPDVGASMLGYAQSTGNAGVQSVSGQLVLSLAGACPYYPQGVSSPSRAEINFQELTAHMVANAMLGYDVKSRRKYKATFHMSHLVERMERMKESGGFFSAKKIHEVVTDTNHSDWFEIVFDADGFDWTPEEQNKFQTEVKGDLMDRALTSISTAAGSPPPLPGLPAETGAGAVAKRAMLCPHIYCWAGGMFLGALDSIFGSKEAVSNFKATNNAWVGDSVSQVKILKRRTMLTFRAP